MFIRVENVPIPNATIGAPPRSCANRERMNWLERSSLLTIMAEGGVTSAMVAAIFFLNLVVCKFRRFTGLMDV